MEMQGSRRLAISQQQAWDALNDPEVLKQCIPGCDRVEATGDNQYAIGMAVRIGPVSARFTGKITLVDVRPPNSYTLVFEGQGGAAGFGKGTAKVNLAPPTEGAGCELTYACTAQVGGKIAQVGQRLIDGVAKAMAEDFFKRFEAEMERRYPQAFVAEAALAPATPDPAAAEEAGKATPAWVWVLLGILVVAALILLLR
ncbi:MAG TPA: carbon monoxide dehydrogenase subunit G [Ramlibacter sp.]|nr:carbon monoxide dehydrogenase subunit G [Ramlibacter sp.]